MVKLKMLNQEENKLLERKEIVLEVMHDDNATPPRAELMKEIAQNLKVDPNLMFITKIKTIYGKSCSQVVVRVYKNRADLERFENLKRLKATQEEKAEPTQTKESTQESQPKEETKQEAKEEAKQETKEETKEEAKQES